MIAHDDILGGGGSPLSLSICLSLSLVFSPKEIKV